MPTSLGTKGNLGCSGGRAGGPYENRTENRKKQHTQSNDCDGSNTHSKVLWIKGFPWKTPPLSQACRRQDTVMQLSYSILHYVTVIIIYILHDFTIFTFVVATY